MTQARLVLVDRPAPGVERLTLNRPEKRNAISNALRGELLEALRRADADGEVRVSVVRGAGPCFSSGYDLESDLAADQPYFTPQVGMQWARHVGEGWMSLWDLAKPVIAQVHGYAMAGGLELVGACDLAYAAADAALSHPGAALRGPPGLRVVSGLPRAAPRHGAPSHGSRLHAARRRPDRARQPGLPGGGARGARARDREDDRRDAARRRDREQALRLHRARGARRRAV